MLNRKKRSRSESPWPGMVWESREQTFMDPELAEYRSHTTYGTMGDITNSPQAWLTRFDKLVLLADDIASDISERGRLEQQSVSTSKITSQIRRGLGQLTTELAHMEDALSKMEADGTGSINITSREIRRRRDMCKNLGNRRDTLQSLLGQRGGRQSKDRSALFEEHGTSGGGGTTWGAPRETDSTRTMDNDGLLKQQEQIMGEQDQGLDMLSETVVRQKELGYTISNELDLQKGLLDDLEGGVNHTRSKVKKENKRVKKLSKKAKQGSSICCLILLLALFITLASTHWGKDIF